jgi:hypothetical protein
MRGQAAASRPRRADKPAGRSRCQLRELLIPPEAGVAGSNPAVGAFPRHAETAADQHEHRSAAVLVLPGLLPAEPVSLRTLWTMRECQRGGGLSVPVSARHTRRPASARWAPDSPRRPPERSAAGWTRRPAVRRRGYRIVLLRVRIQADSCVQTGSSGAGLAFSCTGTVAGMMRPVAGRSRMSVTGVVGGWVVSVIVTSPDYIVQGPA